MRRILTGWATVVFLIALSAGIVTAISSCSDTNQTADLKGVVFQRPEKIEGYSNVDGHPNIIRLCVDGVAFVTTTRKGNTAVFRVPEFDTWCKR